jgi:DNA repair protein RadC
MISVGAESLPDYELLEFILFASQPRGDVKPVAKALLAHFGNFAAVLAADPAALAGAELNLAGVTAIKAAREAGLRLMHAELAERPVVGSWDKLIEYCSAHIAHNEVEEFHVLFLDRKNVLIRHERQQRGTVDHTPVYPREVVKRALEVGATANDPGAQPPVRGSDPIDRRYQYHQGNQESGRCARADDPRSCYHRRRSTPQLSRPEVALRRR